jgi:deoxyribonuclease-4
MSIAGGLPRAVDRAERVEATALQVFVKSSRQWSAKPLDRAEIAAFRDRTDERGLTPYTLAHGTYLINLASPDDDLWRKSRDAFGLEIDRCGQLGIPYLVVHPGSHVGAGERAGMKRVARALRHSLRGRRRRSRASGNGQVTVLLETTAGQGTSLGCRFEQLAWMIEHSGVEDRLGVCFDTCHVLAAGYDIRTPRRFRQAIAEFDRTVGLERLRAFHLNDSKLGPGSRRDRHEHIGKGEVGLDAFRLIVNDRRFRGLPMVLETPKGDDLAEDRENLSVLRSLVGRRGR